MMLMFTCVIAAVMVGFAAHQGGTCGVMAVRHWLERRDARLLAGFVVATGAATCVCLPLAWALGLGTALPGSAPLALPLLAGGVLLGVGAVVNGACLLGSLWRLGNGEAHLIGLPIGIAAGGLLGRALGWQVVPPPGRFAHPDGAGLALVALGALLLVLAGRWLARQGAADRRLAVTMLAMGVAGSLLFVALPGWTWADVVRDSTDAFAHGRTLMSDAGLRVTIATLAGALGSGWMTGQLHLKWRGWPAVARSMAGGLLMMLGIGLIPGGNDALLLWSVPAGAMSGLIGFVVMNLTIAALASARPFSRRARPARH